MFFSIQFKKNARMFSIILFIVYLFLLAYLLFLSPYYGRTLGVPREYNLIPFKTIKNYIVYRRYVTTQIFYTNILGNVLAFMPMGFFVPILFRHKRTFVEVIIVSLLISLIVELLQYRLVVGSFDVDDIILNTIGGGLGFIMFGAVYRLYYMLHRSK